MIALNRWNSLERNWLRGTYICLDLPVEAIAHALHRRVGSIRMMAFYLGLKRGHGWSKDARGHTRSWSTNGYSYQWQHTLAGRDLAGLSYGTCQICEEKEAVHLARMDHTKLPYDLRLVVPMCRSCNAKHSRNHFVILFRPPQPPSC